MTFLVTISRTELITFRVEAASREEAVDRYLMDGDEVASKTDRIDVVNVEQDD